VPIVTWRGQIVDGRHRHMVCVELDNPIRTEDITETCPTEEAMRMRVVSLNQRRSRTKPLTSAEKRKRAKAELKADPARSDVAIAERIGATDKTVAKVRAEMESRSEIRTAAPTERKSRTGKKGEGAKRSKPGGKAKEQTRNTEMPPQPPGPAALKPRPIGEALDDAIDELAPDKPESPAPAPQQQPQAPNAEPAKPEAAPGAGAPAAEVPDPSGQDDQGSEDREDTEWNYEQQKALNEQLHRVGFERILSSASAQILGQFARYGFEDILNFSDQTDFAIYRTRLLKAAISDPDAQKRQQVFEQLRASILNCCHTEEFVVATRRHRKRTNPDAPLIESYNRHPTDEQRNLLNQIGAVIPNGLSHVRGLYVRELHNSRREERIQELCGLADAFGLNLTWSDAPAVAETANPKTAYLATLRGADQQERLIELRALIAELGIAPADLLDGIPTFLDRRNKAKERLDAAKPADADAEATAGSDAPAAG
jgi:hypothetical protein